MTDTVNAPSTEQLLAALAASLLPLAGAGGILVANALPAVQALYDAFTSHPTADFSVDDLVKIVTQSNAAKLAKLQADINAMP